MNVRSAPCRCRVQSVVLTASLDSAVFTARPRSVASASATAAGLPEHRDARNSTNEADADAASASVTGSTASRNCMGAEPSALIARSRGLDWFAPTAALAAASAASVTAAAAAAAASCSAAAFSAASFFAASSLARLARRSLARASGSGTYPGSSWMRLRLSPPPSCSATSPSAPRRLRRSPRSPSPGISGRPSPVPPPPLARAALCLAMAAHRCTRLGSSWPASSWTVSSSACARETTLRPSTTSKPFSSNSSSFASRRSCSSPPQ
mmetsp:Transcript_930/g.3710  ORF Transcript_930/g.3710 Transcript_930/m.3710 type:complete len:267 (-) Transcript_930:308-1108(-)